MNQLWRSVLAPAIFSVLGFMSFVPGADALEIKSFSEAELKSSQAESKAVVVWLHASWCSTCRRQEKSLAELSKDETFANVVVLKADYDNSEALQKALKANRQSTLIAFKGSTEVGRVIGVTRESEIADLLKKTL